MKFTKKFKLLSAFRLMARGRVLFSYRKIKKNGSKTAVVNPPDIWRVNHYREFCKAVLLFFNFSLQDAINRRLYEKNQKRSAENLRTSLKLLGSKALVITLLLALNLNFISVVRADEFPCDTKDTKGKKCSELYPNMCPLDFSGGETCVCYEKKCHEKTAKSLLPFERKDWVGRERSYIEKHNIRTTDLGNIELFDLPRYIKHISNFMTLLAIPVVVAMIVYGGYRYIIGGVIGDKENAKTVITKALTGLMVVIFAYVIVESVLVAFTSSPNTRSYSDTGKSNRPDSVDRFAGTIPTEYADTIPKELTPNIDFKLPYKSEGPNHREVKIEKYTSRGPNVVQIFVKWGPTRTSRDQLTRYANIKDDKSYIIDKADESSAYYTLPDLVNFLEDLTTTPNQIRSILGNQPKIFMP